MPFVSLYPMSPDPCDSANCDWECQRARPGLSGPFVPPESFVSSRSLHPKLLEYPRPSLPTGSPPFLVSALATHTAAQQGVVVGLAPISPVDCAVLFPAFERSRSIEASHGPMEGTVLAWSRMNPSWSASWVRANPAIPPRLTAAVSWEPRERIRDAAASGTAANVEAGVMVALEMAMERHSVRPGRSDGFRWTPMTPPRLVFETNC